MKILFISLGCDKNLCGYRDDAWDAGRKRGIPLRMTKAEAEAAVINTCCFIGDAKEESINTILEMAELKKADS